MRAGYRRFTGWLCGLAALSACGGPVDDSAAALPAKTNVVFILADDFGIVDIQDYLTHFTGVDTSDHYYETPNLNRLVRGGVAFSQAYATQLCSPTRAGILSGRFAPLTGFMTAMPLRETYYNQGLDVPDGFFAHDVLDHHDDIRIPQAWLNGTSNSALPAGAPEDGGRNVVTIAEAMPDHHSAFIGKWHLGGFGAAGHQPADQGFHPLAWFDAGGSTYYNWRPGWNNDALNRFPDLPQERWEMGDAGPATGEPYLTDDLTVQALNFLDSRRGQSDPFFLYFAHFAVHAPYQGKEAEVRHFEEKAPYGGHEDPRYASMVRSLDRSVGAILDRLDSLGMAENTLVVFMSDNGGIDSKITPQPHGTDNAPFLGGKACLTEGGIRVPLIFYWKDRIAGGRWLDVPVDYTDIYPSLVEAAGYDVAPLTETQDLDGHSLLPAILDGAELPEKTRYWHYPFNVIYNSPYDGYPLTPHSAIRRGKHKLTFDWHGRLHLYDLETDPYERDDLADRAPDLKADLFADLLVWLREEVPQRYWPRPNPAYDPAAEVREEPFVNLVEE